MQPNTPGMLHHRPESMTNSSEHGATGMDGARPNTRGSALSVTLKEPTPREHRGFRASQGRPGTTGNNKVISSPIRSPDYNNLRQRPATEGRQRDSKRRDSLTIFFRSSIDQCQDQILVAQ